MAFKMTLFVQFQQYNWNKTFGIWYRNGSSNQLSWLYMRDHVKERGLGQAPHRRRIRSRPWARMEQWQTNTPSKAGLMKTVKLQANYLLALGFWSSFFDLHFSFLDFSVSPHWVDQKKGGGGGGQKTFSWYCLSIQTKNFNKIGIKDIINYVLKHWWTRHSRFMNKGTYLKYILPRAYFSNMKRL